jgi:hypothetical protein
MITMPALPLAANSLAGHSLADGPAMYFGSSIMTFALPLGAFIVIAVALFVLFRSAHSGPRLRYLAAASFTSVGTREPGPVPAPPVAAAAPEATAGPRTPATPETTAEGKGGAG